MKVKYIKENYFDTVDKLKVKKEKERNISSEERVSKISTAVLNKQILESFKKILGTSIHDVHLYGFISAPYSIFDVPDTYMTDRYNNDFTSDLQCLYIPNYSNKTITVDITFGANYIPSSSYESTSNQMFILPLYGNEMLYKMAVELAPTYKWTSKVSPDDYWTLENLNKNINNWFESALENPTMRSNAISIEEKNTLKEYTIVLNPIHMFPGRNFDVIIDLTLQRFSDPVRTFHDEVIQGLKNIFSFENNGKAYISERDYKSDPEYKNGSINWKETKIDLKD